MITNRFIDIKRETQTTSNIRYTLYELYFISLTFLIPIYARYGFNKKCSIHSFFKTLLSFFIANDRHANRRTLIRRTNHQRIFNRFYSSGIKNIQIAIIQPIFSLYDHDFWRIEFASFHHLFLECLIHSYRTSSNSTSSIRNMNTLQKSLNLSIFSKFSMQCKKC